MMGISHSAFCYLNHIFLSVEINEMNMIYSLKYNWLCLFPWFVHPSIVQYW